MERETAGSESGAQFGLPFEDQTPPVEEKVAATKKPLPSTGPKAIQESCQTCVNCVTSREGVRSSFDKTAPVLTARIELISPSIQS